MDYSHVAVPLTNLTQKGQSFQWTPAADAAFTDLRSRFLKAPVLIHPNFEKPFVVETDASDKATEASGFKGVMMDIFIHVHIGALR